MFRFQEKQALTRGEKRRANRRNRILKNGKGLIPPNCLSSKNSPTHPSVIVVVKPHFALSLLSRMTHN